MSLHCAGCPPPFLRAWASLPAQESRCLKRHIPSEQTLSGACHPCTVSARGQIPPNRVSSAQKTEESPSTPPPPPTRFARPPPPPQACREMRLLPQRMLRGEGEGQRLKRADGSAFHPNIQSSGRPPSSGEEGSCPPPTVSRLGSTEAPGDETAPRRGGQRLQTRRHNRCPRCPRRYAREQGIEDEACIPSPRGHPPTGQ